MLCQTKVSSCASVYQDGEDTWRIDRRRCRVGNGCQRWVCLRGAPEVSRSLLRDQRVVDGESRHGQRQRIGSCARASGSAARRNKYAVKTMPRRGVVEEDLEPVRLVARPVREWAGAKGARQDRVDARGGGVVEQYGTGLLSPERGGAHCRIMQ